MLEPMAFLFMPPTKYSRNPRGPDSGFHPPSPLPQAREPGACQVLLLMILWGRPEGPRTLALDAGSRSRTLLLLGGRRGLPPPPRGRGSGVRVCTKPQATQPQPEHPGEGGCPRRTVPGETALLGRALWKGPGLHQVTACLVS